ncbi:MAG: ABC transporter substrate-binding protein [Polyangiaceae bacterium]|nr:ABC transporter substrate-binding protein [Polyangiaceae bacterium]
MRTGPAVAFMAALLLCSTGSAVAGPGHTAAKHEAQNPTSASDAIRDCQQRLTTLLKKGPSTGDQISASIDGLLDYRTLAERSLGRYWADRTPAERNEFTSVLTQLVRASYRKHLSRTLDYDVTYLGESTVEGGTLVKSQAKNRTKKREEAVSIDYVAHRVNDHWRVIDIVTDGTSLVRNYRSQFHRIVKKDGFKELMRKLNRKLAKQQG